MNTLILALYLTVAVVILAAWPVWAVWAFYGYRRDKRRQTCRQFHVHYSPRDGAMVPDSYDPNVAANMSAEGM